MSGLKLSIVCSPSRLCSFAIFLWFCLSFSLKLKLCCFIASDVDECKSSVCPSSMACINTFGSFTCDCGSGQQYNAARKKCIGNNNVHIKGCRILSQDVRD